MNRSPVMAASESAVIAVMTGARAEICKMPVPSRQRSVTAAR